MVDEIEWLFGESLVLINRVFGYVGCPFLLRCLLLFLFLGFGWLVLFLWFLSLGWLICVLISCRVLVFSFSSHRLLFLYIDIVLMLLSPQLLPFLNNFLIVSLGALQYTYLPKRQLSYILL